MKPYSRDALHEELAHGGAEGRFPKVSAGGRLQQERWFAAPTGRLVLTSAMVSVPFLNLQRQNKRPGGADQAAISCSASMISSGL